MKGSRRRTGAGRAHAARLAWACALVLAWAGPQAPLAASPLEDSTLGGAVFTGPVHAHATAIYMNPAALGLAGQGAHLYLDGSLRMDRYGIERRVMRGADGALVAGPQVNATTLAPGGTLAWYNVGEKISLAAAVSWVVLDRFIDEEPGLGYHTLGGLHRQYVWREMYALRRAWELPFEVPLPMPTLAGAYRWQDVYFGAGVSLRATSFELSFFRDTALEGGRAGIDAPCGDMACGVENPAAAERYDIDVSTENLLTARNLVLNGGIMWQFRPSWWLGVHYQSPPGFLSSLGLEGRARVTPAPRTGEEPYTVTAEIIYHLPQTVSVGVRGPAFLDYEVFAAARWQNLSRQRLIDVRLIDPTEGGGGAPEWFARYRGFEDVYTFTAGLEQREGARLRAGARLQLQTAATTERTISPLQVEGLGVTGALGAELRVLDSPRLVLYASYGLTYYPTVTAGADSYFDPREQIACVDSGYDIDACTPAAEGRAVPTAAGEYERMQHAFRAAIRYDFR